jgi:hypothetical protein
MGGEHQSSSRDRLEHSLPHPVLHWCITHTGIWSYPIFHLFRASNRKIRLSFQTQYGLSQPGGDLPEIYPYENAVFACAAGTYLLASATMCTACAPGNYCPWGVSKQVQWAATKYCTTPAITAPPAQQHVLPVITVQRNSELVAVPAGQLLPHHLATTGIRCWELLLHWRDCADAVSRRSVLMESWWILLCHWHCRLHFLIASRNKVLRAISWFWAPPRNCRKCENRDIFAISFEHGSAFKFYFEGSKAHVLQPRKHQEYSGLISDSGCGTQEVWSAVYSSVYERRWTSVMHFGRGTRGRAEAVAEKLWGISCTLGWSLAEGCYRLLIF